MSDSNVIDLVLTLVAWTLFQTRDPDYFVHKKSIKLKPYFLHFLPKSSSLRESHVSFSLLDE